MKTAFDLLAYFAVQPMKKTTLLLVFGLCFGISGLAQGSSKEAEDFYNFNRYYHSKREIVEETEGKKETIKAVCYGTARWPVARPRE